MADAGLRGDVLERAVAAVAVQPVPRLLRDRRIGQRAAVDQEDVDPAVVVVVEEQPAGAHGLDQVLVGAGAVDVAEVHAGAAGDVGEPHVRRLRIDAGHGDDDGDEPATGDVHRTGLPPRSAASYITRARAASGARPALA